MHAIDWNAVRADFPILSRTVHDKPLVYLDSANTAQKPQAVIDAVDDFYRRHNANVSRAVHQLGSEATEAYEGARRAIARFVNVRPDDLVLTSGTTQAINLVAYSFALPRLQSRSKLCAVKKQRCRGTSSQLHEAPWICSPRARLFGVSSTTSPPGARSPAALRTARTGSRQCSRTWLSTTIAYL